MVRLLFWWLVLQVIWFNDRYSIGLLNARGIPIALRVILVFLLFDLWMYLWHFANHNLDFLWLFHRMHHTEPEMDVTTSVRFHPGEIALSTLLRLPVFMLLGMNLTLFLTYELVMTSIVFFHHSNINLPEKLDRLLRYVIVTPQMHRVHHSTGPGEMRSNLASIFSFWDRLGRTFRQRDDTSTIKFGIDTLEGPRWESLQGMIATPFRQEKQK
jgi:sterol desaturase/sphingolipid hydroxylase (fatty acid hydroxylase superfamily)